MRRIALAVALSALALVGAACGPASAARLVYCSEASPDGFDPALYTSGATFDASSRTIYDRLVLRRPGTTEPMPGLAESWTISPDGLEYVFRLRRGVAFHSTSYFTPTREFNADDVIFSLQRQIQPDHPYARYVKGGAWDYAEGMSIPQLIKSIDKVDDYTVRMVLTRADAEIIADLAMDFGSILSAEYAEKLAASGRKEQLNSAPIGTGPFQFVSYSPISKIEYAANPDYWGGKPQIDELVFKIEADSRRRVSLLRSGECQVASYPNVSEIADLKADPEIRVAESVALNVGYLAFNALQKPFDDPRVRMAISMAIDRNAIVREVFAGAAVVAKNPIPPTVWSFNDQVDDYPYDPAAARKMLAEAGVRNLTMKIWSMPVARPYNPNGQRTAEMIKEDLAAIGVKVEIVKKEWVDYLTASRAKDRDGAVLLGWTGDNGDPANFLDILLGCKGVGSVNRAQWCNKDFDELTRKAKAATDQRERAQYYKQAQSIFREEAPWATIAHSITYLPMSRSVQGFTMDPMGGVNFGAVRLGDANTALAAIPPAASKPAPDAAKAASRPAAEQPAADTPGAATGLTQEAMLRKQIEAQLRKEFEEKLRAKLSANEGVVKASDLEGRRVALVVGNNIYDNVNSLQKAVGDASAVSKRLEELGFAVTVGRNLSIIDTERTISHFVDDIRPGDTVFFHFSGHGIEVNGDNLLLATDVPQVADGEARVIRRYGLSASQTIEDFQRAGATTVVAVLDACRENPFGARAVRRLGTRGGLGKMDTAQGTFIMFSAGTGQLALDRLSDDDGEATSVFTRTLLQNLGRSDMSLTDIAKATQVEVRDLARSVGHNQTPAYYDQIVGEVRIR